MTESELQSMCFSRDEQTGKVAVCWRPRRSSVYRGELVSVMLKRFEENDHSEIVQEAEPVERVTKKDLDAVINAAEGAPAPRGYRGGRSGMRAARPAMLPRHADHLAVA